MQRKCSGSFPIRAHDIAPRHRRSLALRNGRFESRREASPKLHYASALRHNVLILFESIVKQSATDDERLGARRRLDLS